MKLGMNTMKAWQLVRISLCVGMLSAAVSCGSDKEDDDEDAPADTVAYSTVADIVTTSCATSGCHVTTGGTAPDFKAGGEATFKQYKAKSLVRVKSTSTDVMPQANSVGAAAFSAADKTAMLKYLEQ